MRAFLVDDDLHRHEVIKRRFKKGAYGPVGPGSTLISTTGPLEAIKVLEREPAFDLVLLDHDLNTFLPDSGPYGIRQEITGQDVVRVIVRLPEAQRPRLAIVHSWNPPGANLMVQRLEDAGIPVIYEPFTDGTKGYDSVAEKNRAEFHYLRAK